MLNLGRLIDHATRQLATAYVLNEQAAPAEASYLGFIKQLQSSPLLEAEFSVFENLRRQGVSTELVLEFAKSNLRQLAAYTQQELRTAHQSLEPFLLEEADAATPLDVAIQTLIFENAAPVGRQRVNTYHAALVLVCESLTQPEAHASPPVTAADGYTSDELVQGALQPLTESLSRLSESDRELLAVVVGGDSARQQALFEQYHAQATTLLADYQGTPAAQRLLEMVYTPATVGDDLVDLYTLMQPE